MVFCGGFRSFSECCPLALSSMIRTAKKSRTCSRWRICVSISPNYTHSVCILLFSLTSALQSSLLIMKVYLPFKFYRLFTSPPSGRGAAYCEMYARLSLCLSVCLLTYLKNRMVKFRQIFCTCCHGRGSVLLCRHCNTLCTSGFVYDVMFSHNIANGPESTGFVHFARWRLQSHRQTTLYGRVRQSGGTGREVCCVRLHLIWDALKMGWEKAVCI